MGIKRRKANNSMIMHFKENNADKILRAKAESNSPVKPRKLRDKMNSENSNKLTINLMQKLTEK